MTTKTMNTPKELQSRQLCSFCDAEQFSFKTTDELTDLTTIIGQERAINAVNFGLGIKRKGYNLYVMGPSGSGKHTLVQQHLEQSACQEPVPDDWCYVNNFEQPHKPSALRFAPGTVNQFRQQIQQLIEDLCIAIPASFETDEYRNRHQGIEEEHKQRQEEAFSQLSEEASAAHIKLFRTNSGFAFAPVRDGEIIEPDEFGKLPAEEQERIEKVVASLQEKLQKIINDIPLWRKDSREQVKELNREFSQKLVRQFMQDLREQYAEHKDVQHYLSELEKDIIENVAVFRRADESVGEGGQESDPRELNRYKVNVLVQNDPDNGAPVIYLDQPTVPSLIGRSEHLAQFGTLITDFTLIKPGAMHQASGGYLIIDVRKLLMQPFAWEGLKRALYSGEVAIESVEKMLSIVSTASLEPQPIPIDLKVVLLGDRTLYYLLHEYDPDFAELFKVQADFSHSIERNEKSHLLFAELVATLTRKENLKAFDHQAVACVIDYSARLIEDAHKLSTHMRSIADLLCEADHWASQNAHEVVGREDVQTAIEQQRYRASRVQEQLQENIHNGIVLIQTEGSHIGQVNGLSVLHLGDYEFGQPSRITATVHIGEGDVVDIEREVELGGEIHSKGVMILSSFIASRYARKQPLSLSASLAFEQSYGGVDGDSASLGELCALLSAIAELPVRQDLAITGSLNQHGEVQAIGGVNEKIEGFFDVCKQRGLTGKQGVLIPHSNVRHLMLREDVIKAVDEGHFHIYPIEQADEALTLLLNTTAGKMDDEGHYPTDSINGLVYQRLTEMSMIRAHFTDKEKDKHEHDGEEHNSKDQ